MKTNIYDAFDTFSITNKCKFTQKQIKKTYYKLSLKYHPDKINNYQNDNNCDKHNSQEQFITIQKSYECINDYIAFCERKNEFEDTNNIHLYKIDDNVIKQWSIHNPEYNYTCNKEHEITPWDFLSKQFIQFIKENYKKTNIFDTLREIFQYIIHDNATYDEIFEFIHENCNFEIGDNTLYNYISKLRTMNIKKQCSNQIFKNTVLYVSLDDIIQDRVITYNINGDNDKIDDNTLFLPCWHNYLEFRKNNIIYNFEIKKLEEKIHIDDNNDLHIPIELKQCILREKINKYFDHISLNETNNFISLERNLFTVNSFDEYINKHDISMNIIDIFYYKYTVQNFIILIPLREIRFADNNYTIVLQNKGISRINYREKFDTSVKGNIHIYVE